MAHADSGPTYAEVLRRPVLPVPGAGGSRGARGASSR
jgi:hypothetical protein